MAFAIKMLHSPGTLVRLLQYYHNQNIHTYAQLNSFKSWYQSKWMPRKTEPPYNHIVQIGDPVLRQKSALVPLDAIKTKELNFFIDQLTDVLHRYKLAGVAAPQVGMALKIIVMEFSDRLKDEFTAEEYRVREMARLPLTVMINPELTVTDYNKTIFEEACASVCGYTAEVPRYAAVTLTGLDRNGEKQELQLKGWNARIAQHEMDHLNGIVFTDIMKRQSLSCSCWHTVNVKEGQVTMSFGPK